MIKKTIKYIDYDGEEKNIEARFHLNKLEVIRMMGKDGDLEAKAKELAEKEDVPGMLDFIEDMILSAYGTLEGERFVKTPEARQAFSESEAYAELFADLITNQAAASDFASKLINKPKAKPARATTRKR